MRKLNTADVFAAVRIIRASGMRDQLLPVIRQAAAEAEGAEGAERESILAKIGVNGFMVVLEAMAEKRAEAEVYATLAGPFECSPEDVREMPLDELWPKLQQLAEENRLKDFFGYVSGILGKT